MNSLISYWLGLSTNSNIYQYLIRDNSVRHIALPSETGCTSHRWNMCLLTIRLEVIKYESATHPDTIIHRQWEFSWGRSIKLIDDNVFYHACLWRRCVVGNILSCIFTSTTTQLSLNASPMICTPLPEKCIWSWCNLDLENLSINSHSHGEYLWQVSLKSLHYRDITSHKTDVNGWPTGSCTDNWIHHAFATYC